MTTNSNPSKPVQKLTIYQWIRLVLVYLFIPLVIFVFAWDLRWWQAWAYSVLVFIAGILGRILAEKRHPGLLAERANFEKAEDVKPWDKILAPLMAFCIAFPLVIVAGIDHKNHWSPSFPLWVNILGLVLAACGYAFAVWALIENRFFSGQVRIQTDRGHTVCDTGPYRIVRHPGYLGNILPLAGIVMALSSLWAIIPAVFALIIVIIRTVLEDRTLQEELPGYREYARKIKYRLLPGIF
jgi:protein-S-isoprenylcysteine O-methyltransferase Ste14